MKLSRVVTFLFVFLIHCYQFVQAQSIHQLRTEFENCFKSEDYKCAEKSLKKLIKVDTEGKVRSTYFNNLGTVLRRLDKDKQALEAYNQAIEINNTVPIYFTNRGSLRDKLGDIKGAIDDYTTAIALDPVNEVAHINRATIYRVQGLIDKAELDLNNLLSADPDNFQAISNLAIIKKQPRYARRSSNRPN